MRIQTAEESGLEVRKELAVLPRELDPQVRRHTSALFKAAREGNWERVDGGVLMKTDPEIVLLEGQFEATTAVEADEGSVADVLNSGAFVVLDTVLDAELEAEGYARDVIRAVQDQRKADDLHVADRIRLSLRVPDEKLAAVESNIEMIAAETLALDTSVEGGATGIEATVEKIA